MQNYTSEVEPVSRKDGLPNNNGETGGSILANPSPALGRGLSALLLVVK